jgi:hypothetical protein
LDSSNAKLIQYFGGGSHIIIPEYVQILGPSCFSRDVPLAWISLGTDSKLARIESKVFYSCSSLESITVVHHVRVLGWQCFASYDLLS